MNAKLDPNLLRATSAEHALECASSSGARRLELVEVPCPVGAVTFASTHWERLDREKATILFAVSSALTRIGVTTFYAGKYVSYRECSPEEMTEAIRQFQSIGFTGPRPYEVKP